MSTEGGWAKIDWFKGHLHKTLTRANTLKSSGDCKGGEVKGMIDRRRRSVDNEFNKGIKTEGKNFFRDIARWIKFELYDNGEAKCEHQATRLLKRVDRLYYIFKYQACRAGAKAMYCKEIGGPWLNKNGNTRDHPRRSRTGKFSQFDWIARKQ